MVTPAPRDPRGERAISMGPQPCACGGWISPELNDPVWITSAVRQHQLTARHQEWRAFGGLDYDPELQGRV